MIESYVGPEAFRQGVTSYLKRFSYANAAGEDFWNEIAKVTGKPVDRVMHSFVDKAGAPVLSVETRCVANRTTEVDLSMHDERVPGAECAERPGNQWNAAFVGDAHHLPAGARRIGERADDVHHRRDPELTAHRPDMIPGLIV